MIGQALWFSQFLAARDFSPADLTSLRADLIAFFRKEPARQMQDYKAWQWYGDNPDAFRDFQSYPKRTPPCLPT